MWQLKYRLEMHLDVEFRNLLKITQPFFKKKKQREDKKKGKKSISNLITLYRVWRAFRSEDATRKRLTEKRQNRFFF